MRLSLLTCLFFYFLVHSSLFSQEHQQRLGEIDIVHYQFQLQLSETTDTIYGLATIDIRFLKPMQNFYLDLQSNTGEKGMFVTEVKNQARALRFQQQGNQLHLELSAPSLIGETHRISIRYAGIPADGLIISENRYGDRTFFGDNWPDRAHHWLPCVDHPADKATVAFIVTAPDHYQVIGNGLQIEETNVTDALKVTHWKTEVPLPTKVMVIGAARFAVQRAGEVEGIPVTSWVYPQDREAGFGDYQIAVDILDFFVEKMGSYPYEKLANVQSKTRYGGMENASNIFYAEKSVNGKQDQEKLIAHEIAHQWFGNSASEANWHHVWLSEGFATYLTDLYLEEVRGRDSFVENLQKERRRVINFAHKNPVPIIDTSITNYNLLLNANSYQKGAWVLHMLRREIGDKAFWKGIRTYYQRYQLSNALSADLQNVMEEVSGKSLGAFFRQWLYRAGHPVLRVDWKKNTGKQIDLTIRQLQGAPFSFPLEITLIGKNGKTQKQLLRITDKTQQLSISFDGEIENVLLDPDTWLLFEKAVD